MEDEEKKNDIWMKIRILTKHSFNLICGYISKLFFTEVFFIRLNDYLSVNRWTGKVHMRPSVMCKKFKGKDTKEIKILLKYAFISGFESIQYISGRLIFSFRKTIKFDTHDYIINKFEDINKYNDSKKQFSIIEYTKLKMILRKIGVWLKTSLLKNCDTYLK